MSTQLPTITCATCARPPTTTGPLKKCARCHTTSYCSRECQRADWKTHKRVCTSTTTSATAAGVTGGSREANGGHGGGAGAGGGSGSGASVNDEAYHYWNYKAHLDPQAVELAGKIGLEFPGGERGLKSGITYPLRRLIATGTDTPSSLTLLFGTATPPDGTSSVRKHVLLDPPPGSPAYVMYSALDANLPSFSPRPMTAEEEEEIEEIRDMQRRIEKVVGGRGREVGKEVMAEVLAGLEGGWAEKVGVYGDAVNTMDQGVLARGV